MTDKKFADSGFKVLPWDISQKGIILSSMFWGYVIPQIPAGHLSRIIGTKYFLFWAMMHCSITTILGPYTAVNFNWLVFCFCRSLQGLGQGFFYPCVNAHISKWAPPSERNRMLGCVYGGTYYTYIKERGQLGSTLTVFLAGYLSASPWGWPSIFYVTGACGVFWSLTWLYVGADCPNSHSTIGDNERAYIKSTIKNCSDRSKEMRTPWRQIITSLPVLPLLLCNFGQLWCYSTMVTMLPLYYRHVLHYDIEENGLISSLPFLTKTLLALVFSCVADFLISRGFLSVVASEKMWNTIAFWGAAAALTSLSFVSSAAGPVVLLTSTVGLSAGIIPGYISNHLDLAPNFTGLLLGITNGLGSIGSILTTLFAGFIVTDEVK
ncbi:putative inorganic phosphate cotransporter [Homalodisca vitripennis]|uniref:putative inorganic phosphate cotransporter n=1 Tax=Homalodisca vitripennis TaxID=197043 RepID=UPI001EEB6511|nr:putative inorganic phosphate cotransporter [Homalodisca vitripennis]